MQLDVKTAIAVGGDGTINEIATVLATIQNIKRPALGILPLGIANYFSNGVGIPIKMQAVLRLVL
ncbi:diacylglycerol kinase family protein [Pantoea sp. Nvir]|uniref:diacylglycerol kinase family protein n=1 Tax=Pantoea sp. Nvir TaxID=2576760 RepID=UPI0027F7A048|nr:putative lipid kinase YegS [Pantoea sp. Nvir]